MITYQQYEHDEKRNRLVGVLVTLITTVLLLGVLYMLGFYYQNPPPEETSIDVIFGDPNAGMNADPSTDPQASQQSPSNPSPDQDLTQDIEDAPSINQNPSDPSQQTSPTETQTTPQVPNIKLPNLSGRNPGGSGDNNTSGQQGDPSGGDDGSPIGAPGSGGSGLGSRKATYVPVGKAKCTVKGQINVKITVSTKGKVVSASFVLKGSTTSNTTCVNEAIQLAKQWQFEPAPVGGETVEDIITILLQ